MLNIVRLNDSTSHGGKVEKVQASGFTVDGLAVARVGDLCSCPIHGPGAIVEGSTHHTIDGRQVAYHGHRTSCGATLIASATMFRDSP